MIVEIGMAPGPRLAEADDLKRFKVRLSGGPADAAAAGGVVISGDDALVPIDLVPTLPGAPSDAAWAAGYRAMVAAAAKHGWIDAERNAIKAHVERA